MVFPDKVYTPGLRNYWSDSVDDMSMDTIKSEPRISCKVHVLYTQVQSRQVSPVRARKDPYTGKAIKKLPVSADNTELEGSL